MAGMSDSDLLPLCIQDYAPAQRQLRVAVVTETYPPEVNGVAMTLGRMVEGLIRRGHQVQLVRPRQTPEDRPQQDGGLEEFLATGVPIPRYAGLKLGMPAKRALNRLWALQRPDLVHVVTEGPLGNSAIAAAHKLKLPVTSDFHTNFHAYSRHYGIGWLQRPIAAYLRRFHNHTEATFVPTHQLARELEVDGYANLQVVARGVDTRLFSPERRSEALRSNWGAGPEDLVVLSVGRMAPEKNLPQVLEAFAAIRTVRPEAKLVFVGDGPARQPLQNRHGEHVFAGMRRGEDLAAHYASGDLFLFPSVTETFGNVTLEALASGLAVVAYDYAAAAELVRPGENGLLAPPGDLPAFCQAATQAAAPETLLRLRANARESILDHDWERIHDAFAGALVRAVKSHERRQQAASAIVMAPD